MLMCTLKHAADKVARESLRQDSNLEAQLQNFLVTSFKF